MSPPSVAIVIPALDEEEALALVLAELSAVTAGPTGAAPEGGSRFVLREIVVVDNGSTDGTAEVARRHGAVVVSEPRRGYGSACLAGLAALKGRAPDIVVFMDADASDDPRELGSLLGPILAAEADLVIGSRVLGERERGALTPVQEFGNRLATFLLRVLYGGRFTDLGPFRATRWEALEGLGMRDTGYGWTVEMQARALRAGLRCAEVPVRCRRRRAGRSKVSGTVRGIFGAGVTILVTLARLRWAR